MLKNIWKEFFEICCNLKSPILWILLAIFVVAIFILWRTRKRKLAIGFTSDLLSILLFGLIAVALLFVISMLFSKITWDEMFSSSPGIIFLILLGTITICGFWLMLKKIHKIIPTIYGFEEVLRTSIEFLDELIETYKKSKHPSPKKFPIKMLCFTPSHGNLSARHVYKDYEKSLMEFAASFDLEICCLEKEEELRSFYGGYLPRFQKEEKEEKKREQENYLVAAYYEGVELFDYLESQGKNVKIYPQKRPFLPTYHFILLPHKALIFIPYSIPPPRDIPEKLINEYKDIKEPIKIPNDLTDGGVKMLAVQTEEQHILSFLQNSFDFYKDVKKNYDPIAKK